MRDHAPPHGATTESYSFRMLAESGASHSLQKTISSAESGNVWSSRRPYLENEWAVRYGKLGHR